MAIPVSQFIPLPTTPDNRKIVFYICNSICVMKQFLNDDANIITGSSAGKKSAYNAGDPSSIPGSGRSAGEGIGYPLQCSWASLVAQTAKNPSMMWETWARSLVGKIPWRREWLPT